MAIALIILKLSKTARFHHMQSKVKKFFSTIKFLNVIEFRRNQFLQIFKFYSLVQAYKLQNYF